MEGVPATPEELASLEGILARPEFQGAGDDGGLQPLLRPLTALFVAALQLLVRLLSPVLHSNGESATNAGIAVAIVIACLALVLFARLWRGVLAPSAELREPSAGGPPAAEAERQLAADLARSGNLRGAVHCQYLAVLRRLDERGLLEYDPSQTNLEHLGRAVVQPRIAAVLEPLVTAFDRLWYGQESCSADDYARFVAQAERVWQAAG